MWVTLITETGVVIFFTCFKYAKNEGGEGKYLEVNTKVHMMDIINMKVSFMEVDKEILD